MGIIILGFNSMLVYSFLNTDVYYFIRIKEYLGLTANICWQVCRNTSFQICKLFFCNLEQFSWWGNGIIKQFFLYGYCCISREDEKGNLQFVDKISENYVMLIFENSWWKKTSHQNAISIFLNYSTLL